MPCGRFGGGGACAPFPPPPPWVRHYALWSLRGGTCAPFAPPPLGPALFLFLLLCRGRLWCLLYQFLVIIAI